MHDASPQARALAGLVADLFHLVLFGLLGFAAADAFAPPQDLPWKPLSLGDPLGLATTAKLERVTAEPSTCMAFLRREKVDVTPAADRSDGAFCVVEHAVTVGPQSARLAPARPLMTCGLAAAFALWTRQSVQPAAREILGSGVAQIDHFGSYACRRVYGRSEGRPSRHALADAVDVAGFRLSDGRRISVLDDWSKGDREAAFLHRIRQEGCRLFRVGLSPDYNAAHHNHLHFDMSPYRLCR